MSSIDYDHARNLHSDSGARRAWNQIFEMWPISSLLDVGAGTGAWLSAAKESGVRIAVGIDGVDSSISGADRVGFPIHKLDLSCGFDLNQQFEMVLCLEVAEHLPPRSASVLVASLVRHAPLVVFSGAAPGQGGQGHINCQWPDYWQSIFNDNGYVCDDQLRWRLWDDELIEPWYRQNLFSATKNPLMAGQERRIKRVVHPQMTKHLGYEDANSQATARAIQSGRYFSSMEYARMFARSFLR